MSFNRIESLMHKLAVEGHISMQDSIAIVASVNFVGEHNPANFQLEYGKKVFGWVQSMTNETAKD